MAASFVGRLTGGATNTLPGSSLGGLTSSTVISLTALHNLFDKVEVAEREAGSIEYRAFDIVNTGDTASTSQVLYILSNTTSTDTSISIGYDATAGSHATNAALETIGSQTTAPASPVISFSQPTLETPITLPAIAAGQAIRVWIRWTVSAGSSAFPNDSCSLRFSYLG